MTALIIDNFAGGGGASTGLEWAFGRPVDVAINHDEAAIAVHAANHPGTRHYCQSIYSVDPMDATGGEPVAFVWFSPDCKHHSKAKGGKPREKYIRDMAHVVPHWIERLKKATPGGRGAPDVIALENVEEFRKWGPLDDRGRPIKERAGEEFDLWVRRIRRQGYKVEWRELRACDYGAPTTRKRLILIARRDGMPIVWPAPTHGRADSVEVRKGRLLPWRSAAECIDWSLPCPSIFGRVRPLKQATCRRIAAGVMKHVVNAARRFIVPITHTKNAPTAHSIDEPLRTVTTAKGGELALAAASLIKLRRNSHGEDIHKPLGTVTAGAMHHGLVKAFLAQHNAGPRNTHIAGRSAAEPMSTITGRGTQQQLVETRLIAADALPPEMMEGAVRCAAFLIKYYGNETGAHPVDEPLGTVTTRERFAVITVTIDAVTFVLVDIGMRMLTPRELANAQGFPPDYILDPVCTYRTERGNLRHGRLPKTHQIAKIGNAVCPPLAEAIARANRPDLCTERKAA